MTDFADLRRTMVDTQIRPSDVTKFPILDAMLNVPREKFVPDAQRAVAYSGDDIPLGGGRVVLAPRSLAKMLEALDISGDELVLDIGSGMGYSAAVVARMAEAVVAVEDDEGTLEEAQSALSETGADNVILHKGALSDGAAEHGPYDVILVQGAAEQLPTAIADQLKEGGRIACIFMENALGTFCVGVKVDGDIAWRHEYNLSAPVLPGFERESTFAL